MLGLNAETEGDVEKTQILARGKYLATAFLVRSDRRRYGELIMSLKTTMTSSRGITQKPSLTCTD